MAEAFKSADAGELRRILEEKQPAIEADSNMGLAKQVAGFQTWGGWEFNLAMSKIPVGSSWWMTGLDSAIMGDPQKQNVLTIWQHRCVKRLFAFAPVSCASGSRYLTSKKGPGLGIHRMRLGMCCALCWANGIDDIQSALCIARRCSCRPHHLEASCPSAMRNVRP